MIDHIWSVACQRGVIDNRTNTVSLFDALEQINIPKDFAGQDHLPIQFEVVTFWARSDPAVPCQGAGRLSVYSPLGKRLKSHPVVALDLSEYQRFRSILSVQGFPLVGEGHYSIRVELQNEGATRWRRVAKIPIQVVFVTTDNKPQVGGTTKGKRKKTAK